MDNLDKKKRDVADLLYFKNLYGSPDNKKTNLHYRKMVLSKIIIQGMLNMFTFHLKKSPFFSGRGIEPPPLIAELSAKKSRFLRPPLVRLQCCHWNIFSYKHYFCKKEKRGQIKIEGKRGWGWFSLAIIIPETIFFFFLLPLSLFFYCCGEWQCSFSSDDENSGWGATNPPPHIAQGGGTPLTPPPALNTSLSPYYLC